MHGFVNHVLFALHSVTLHVFVLHAVTTLVSIALHSNVLPDMVNVQ